MWGLSSMSRVVVVLLAFRTGWSHEETTTTIATTTAPCKPPACKMTLMSGTWVKWSGAQPACEAENQRLCSTADIEAQWQDFADRNKNWAAWVDKPAVSGCIAEGSKSTENAAHFGCNNNLITDYYNVLCCPLATTIPTATTRPTTTIPNPTFDLVGEDKQCWSQQNYLPGSSKEQDTLPQCLNSCMMNSACMGFTYYRSNHCSHYSQMCDKPAKNAPGARSYKYVGPTRTTPQTPTRQQEPAHAEPAHADSATPIDDPQTLFRHQEPAHADSTTTTIAAANTNALRSPVVMAFFGLALSLVEFLHVYA